MLLCSFLTLKCFSCYLPLIAMCGELSEVFAQLLGFCCFCTMRTLCKSSLEIATTLHPRRRTFYLLVESAKYEHSRCMAVQLPSVHPLRIDLPDSGGSGSGGSCCFLQRIWWQLLCLHSCSGGSCCGGVRRFVSPVFTLILSSQEKCILQPSVRL